MGRPRTGKTHTGIRREVRANGDVYVYERTTGYDPVTKKTKTLSTVLRGVIRAGTTEEVPTRPKRESSPSSSRAVAENPHRSYLEALLDKIGEESGIDQYLQTAFGERDAQMMASIARYSLITEGASLERMETWQLENQVPYAGPISTGLYSDLCTRIGQDTASVQRYFLARARQVSSASALLQITVDSEPFSPEPDDDQEEDDLDAIKLLLLTSTTEHQPIAFALQPRNLRQDVAVVAAAQQLDGLPLGKPLFVGDHDFYSPDNVAHLIQHQQDFLLLAPMSERWVQEAIEKAQDELTCMSHRSDVDEGLFGMTLPCTQTFSSEKNVKEKATIPVFVHVFYQESFAVEQKSALLAYLNELKAQLEEGVDVFTSAAQAYIDQYLKVERCPSGVTVTFNDESIADDQKYLGHFVLVSTTIDQPFVALEIYRRRQTMEEALEISEDTFRMPRHRSLSRSEFFGSVFCQVVSLGYQCFFQEKIEQIKAQLKKNTAQTAPEQNLLTWLEETSLVDILDWLSYLTTLRTATSTYARDIRRETAERDQLFLALLGIEST